MSHNDWEPLNPGDFKVSANDRGVDPLWVWGDATKYRDFGFNDLNPAQQLWFVVEDSATSQEPGARSSVPFRSKMLSPGNWKGEGVRIEHTELAEPVFPERSASRSRVEAQKGDKKGQENQGTSTQVPKSKAEVLVGVIDSGCPFAAPMIRDATGEGTRVLSIWDQDDERPAFTAASSFLPLQGYGCAIKQDALNEAMRDARAGDSIDEDLCYRLVGYRAVRGRFSHGAAVMSQLFDPIPLDRSVEPVSAQPLAIDKADLVFVQMPRAGTQDSTSAALARYVIDGLHYIIDHARRGQRVIVNISSGTSRTTHDGQSLLERALLNFVNDKSVDLRIVIPTGNNNEEQRHAVLGSADDGQRLDFFLPPGCEMPQYVTVRWPAESENVGLAITPPGEGAPGKIAQGKSLGWPGAQHPQCGVISPLPLNGGASRSLIAFAPTLSHDQSRTIARSGVWQIRLFSKGSKPGATPSWMSREPVMFWISRNQQNPGALARGRQARFLDSNEEHNLQRYLRCTLDDPPPILDATWVPSTASGIRRDGALSGIATVCDTEGRIVVVGGIVATDRNQAPSRYSAAGPAAGTSAQRRMTPDFSAPSDVSWALPGTWVRGNRSGEVVRVIGTSFAAPLIARAIINREGPFKQEGSAHQTAGSISHPGKNEAENRSTRGKQTKSRVPPTNLTPPDPVPDKPVVSPYPPSFRRGHVL